jgi:Hypervirulence associated proteins TUDOR domain
MTAKLQPGDRVRWKTSQGETRGKVVRKVNAKTRIKGHTGKADPEHPQYLVESEKTGARAVHQPDALKKA